MTVSDFYTIYFLLCIIKMSETKTKDYRHFTVSSSSLGPNFEGGSYKLNKKSKSGPKSVAVKAARRMFNVEGGAKASQTVRFTLRETTKGSAKEMREYEARLQKLDPVKTRMIDGMEHVQQYEVQVKPVNRNEHKMIRGGNSDENVSAD